jgi:hypothetical protein
MARRTNRWWFWEAALLVAVLLIAWAVKAYAVDEPLSRKMGRQMDVMTQIVDHMLVESPNFFVRRDDVRGMYIQEFGVILSFGASLVQDDFDKEFKQWEKGGGFRDTCASA